MQSIDISVVAFTANVIGLCSGMTGTALIYFFGVPRQTASGGVNFLTLEGDQRYDINEIARIKRFKCRGNAGLGLVFLAFLLQLLALLMGL